MPIANFNLTKPLEKKINQVIKTQGFASKAEFFRFAVMQYINTLQADISQEELDESLNELHDLMKTKLAGKKLPPRAINSSG